MRSQRQDSHQSTTHQRAGSAIVETAFVLPILLSVTFGVVEFGRAMMVSNLLTNAAREGARYGVIPGITTAEVKAEVIDLISRTIGVTITDSDVDVTVTAYPGNPNPNNETANANKRDLVEVEVRVDYDDVGYFFRYLAGVTLRGQSAMRHE